MCYTARHTGAACAAEPRPAPITCRMEARATCRTCAPPVATPCSISTSRLAWPLPHRGSASGTSVALRSNNGHSFHRKQRPPDACAWHSPGSRRRSILVRCPIVCCALLDQPSSSSLCHHPRAPIEVCSEAHRAATAALSLSRFGPAPAGRSKCVSAAIWRGWSLCCRAL